MSNPSIPGAPPPKSDATGTPAEKSGEDKSPQPKSRTYKAASKHDWCTVTATSESEARQKWGEFFGIKGSDHEVEVKPTSDNPGQHSGQRTASTFILTGKRGSLAEPAKAL